jgi:hypothetical protein
MWTTTIKDQEMMIALKYPPKINLLKKWHKFLFKIPWRWKHNKMNHKGCEQCLKLESWIFEKSQGEHNNLDCQIFLGVISIICKVSMIKIWCKLMMFQKFFCMFKTFKIYLWTIIFLAFKCPFLTSNVHHSF